MFKSCVNTQETRVDVHFIFRTAYDFHLSLLRKVYQRFVEDPKHSVLKLTDSDYFLQNCTESCQAVMVNPHNRKDSGTSYPSARMMLFAFILRIKHLHWSKTVLVLFNVVKNGQCKYISYSNGRRRPLICKGCNSKIE